MRNVGLFVAIVIGDAGMSNRAWEAMVSPSSASLCCWSWMENVMLLLVSSPGDVVCIKDGCDNLGLFSKSW